MDILVKDLNYYVKTRILKGITVALLLALALLSLVQAVASIHGVVHPSPAYQFFSKWLLISKRETEANKMQLSNLSVSGGASKSNHR